MRSGTEEFVAQVRFVFGTIMYQCALQTYRFSQLFVVFIVTSITCQSLILNFLDFDVYVVMTLIFPANQRRCASSSKNVAILSLWSKRAIIAPNNLIDSHHYKRHKKIRMTEFHSPSLSISIHIITESFLIILNYSKMIARLVESFRNLHLFHSNVTKT